MKSSREILAVAVLLFAGAWLMFAQSQTQSPSTEAKRTEAASGLKANSRVSATDFTAGLPLAFEQNAGQAEPGVRFLSRQGPADLYLMPAEAIARFHGDAHQLRMRFVGGLRRWMGLGGSGLF